MTKASQNGPRVLVREMKAQTIGGHVLLDAVASMQGMRRAHRLFFQTGAQIDSVRGPDESAPSAVHNFGGAQVVDVVSEDQAADLPVTIGGEDGRVALHPEETDLFAGLNVCCSVRNGETVETVRDWLQFHVARCGMNAVLIIDRARPGKSKAFARKLERSIGALDGLKRVVVLHADIPLGKSGLPAEAHPFNVPGAPGKDRMDMPPPDSWRAPLGEVLIYEIARSRFLARARAVANIDLYDLIAPDQDGTPFDRAVKSQNGYILLEGRQCYPWRVRPGSEPGFGDHICTQFDAPSVRRRWCVAPAKVDATTTWRLIRIVGAAPAMEGAMRFYRFMALRHPTDSISKIVPKTGLVEAVDLVDLATGYFDAKPIRIPEERITRRSRDNPTTTIVTTMKNEGPFILEWLAYHRMIGVNSFLIYTNDCTDGTDTMLELLQGKGIVQHRVNPFRKTGLKPQHAALQAADDEPIVRDADWLACIDVDEFINIKCGSGRLPDLFATIGDANMVSMTWRLFGNNDMRPYEDHLICETFTRCAHEVTRKPHQAWGFKTLFRNNGIFKKLGVHRPKGLKPQLWENIRWVNGSGKPMPHSMYRNGWRSSMSTYGYDLVQLNHYAVRSAESFLVKRDRGRVNHVERDQGLSYWFRMNNNAEEEHSIQRMIPALRAELDTLLADPDIAAAHAHAVRAHREKIVELKQRPDYQALFDTLTSRKLQRLSRLHAHFGANVFLGGPNVIPDEIAQKEPEDDFWFTVKRGETTH